jgi:hypothetical protein
MSVTWRHSNLDSGMRNENPAWSRLSYGTVIKDLKLSLCVTNNYYAIKVYVEVDV